jgi:hypothetical protein
MHLCRLRLSLLSSKRTIFYKLLLQINGYMNTFCFVHLASIDSKNKKKRYTAINECTPIHDSCFSFQHLYILTIDYTYLISKYFDKLNFKVLNTIRNVTTFILWCVEISN